MEAYGQSKARLFREFDLKCAIINAEDAFGRVLLADSTIKNPKASVGRAQGELQLSSYRLGLQGVEAEVKGKNENFMFSSRIIGAFNLDNLLLVIALLQKMAFSDQQITAALASLEAVPGRMQAVVADKKPLVIIDYAHTPDALEKALQAVRAHTSGQLWCVFGCGGDRDVGKRELMGEMADRHADRLVVTSDNPRTEVPEQIIEMIRQGIDQHSAVYEVDRAVAIRQAIESAGEGDLVLIAGKGHEGYQEIDGVRYPFSDLQLTREILGVAA